MLSLHSMRGLAIRFRALPGGSVQSSIRLEHESGKRSDRVPNPAARATILERRILAAPISQGSGRLSEQRSSIHLTDKAVESDREAAIATRGLDLGRF